jgi:hypothetical protein
MARKRDKLKYEPMYKPGSTEAKPAKRQSLWKIVFRKILSLLGGRRDIELETQEEGRGRRAKMQTWFR